MHMWRIQFNNMLLSLFMVLISIPEVIFILLLLYAFYLIIIGHRFTSKLDKMIYTLSEEGVTIERTESFIKHLDVKYIPFYANSYIRAGYQLVEMDEEIDDSLKKRLKVRILGKGISL